MAQKNGLTVSCSAPVIMGPWPGGKKKKHPSAIPIDTNNGSSFQKTNDLEHRSHGFEHRSNDLAHYSNDIAHCSKDLAHRSKDLDPCSKSMDLG